MGIPLPVSTLELLDYHASSASLTQAVDFYFFYIIMIYTSEGLERES